MARYVALGAFFVGATLGLAACGGGGIPGDSVVKVGDSDTITRSEFDHWIGVLARSSQQQAGSKAKVVIPKPPDFAECVANKRKTAPKTPKGQPTPTDAQRKGECKQEYEGMRDQVLAYLIQGQWILGEAADQGLKMSAKDVDKELAKIKKQSFSKESEFKDYLRRSGQTLDDVRFQVRVNTLTTKLQQKIVKGKDKVTAGAIASYYKKNKSRFAQPEKRDLRIVLTKTKAKADAARAALESGQSWKSVAKRFSLDQASKGVGGVLLAVAKGQQEKALDAAVFAASKGTLSGPVKTQFGYYVFMVTKVSKPTQQTLKQATTAIKQQLAAENQQSAVQKFSEDFGKKWKAKTDCRSGFVVENCKNAPKQAADETSTAPPGAAPTG